MIMRFMGPCLTRVNISPEQIVGLQQNYLRFWEAVANEQANVPANETDRSDAKAVTGVQIDGSHSEFKHTLSAAQKRQALYQTVESDSSRLPAHAADLVFRLSGQVWQNALDRVSAMQTSYYQSASAEELAAVLGAMEFMPESARVRLYYSGKMIPEFDVRLAASLFSDQDDQFRTAARLSLLEWAGSTMFQIISGHVERALTEFMTSQLKRPGQQLQQGIRIGDDIPASGPESAGQPSSDTVAGAPSSDANGSIGRNRLRGSALWVTRSLIIESNEAQSDESAQNLLALWLAPVAQDDWNECLKTQGYSMPWLRYAFNEPEMQRKGVSFDDPWESMLFSQFFWATLEAVEHEMFALLSEIGSSKSGVSLKQSYRQLGQVRECAELTLAHYEHLKRYFTRSRSQIISRIMNGWGFPSLVQNLRDTIALCHQRHQTLLQRVNARNSVLTDALLFFIGTAAIIELMITLSITGRTLASDAALGLRNEGELNVLEFLASLPMDRLVLASVMVVGAIVGIYFRYRSRQAY